MPYSPEEKKAYLEQVSRKIAEYFNLKIGSITSLPEFTQLFIDLRKKITEDKINPLTGEAISSDADQQIFEEAFESIFINPDDERRESLKGLRKIFEIADLKYDVLRKSFKESLIELGRDIDVSSLDFETRQDLFAQFSSEKMRVYDNDLENFALSTALARLHKEFVSEAPEIKSFAEETKIMRGVWDSFKEYLHDRTSDEFDADKYFDNLHQGLETLPEGGRWSDPNVRELFELGFEVNQVLENEDLSEILSDEFEQKIKRLKDISDLSTTGSSKTELVYHRLKEKHAFIIESLTHKGFENEQIIEMSDVFQKMGRREDFESYVHAINRLLAILNDLNEADVALGEVPDEIKEDLSEDLAVILKKRRLLILTSANNKTLARTLNSVHESVVFRTEKALGSLVEEHETIITDDVKYWLIGNYGKEWFAVQRFWLIHQMGNIGLLTARDIAEIDNAAEVFKNAVGRIIEEQRYNPDVAYQRRLMAVDIQMNRIQEMKKEWEEAEKEKRLGASGDIAEEKDDGEEVSKNIDTSTFEKYRFILDLESWELLNHLVTDDFKENHIAPEVLNAFEAFKDLMKNEGGTFVELADILGLVQIMYQNGFMAKGTTLNLDYLSLRKDAAKEKFQNANSISAYDSLRQTSVYQQGIAKISDLAHYLMAHPGLGWAASSGWSSRGEELMNVCHELLYSGGDLRFREGEIDIVHHVEPDAEYAGLIDSFEDKGGQFGRADATKFIKYMAWYETSLNDFRSQAAMIHLGVKRSSFKHTDNQGVEGVADLLSATYKLNTATLGPTATLISGIVTLPNSLRNGYLMLSEIFPQVAAGQLPDAKIEPSQYSDDDGEGYIDNEKEIMVFEDLLNNYMRWLVGSEYSEVIRKMQGSLFLISPVSGFLRAPLDANGKRNPENNAANYYQAKEAISKLIEMVTNRFSNPIELDDNPAKLRAQVLKLLSDLGSEISKACSWRWSYEHQYGSVEYEKNSINEEHPMGVPKGGQKPEAIARDFEQRELLRVFAQTYTLAIFASIPWDDTISHLLDERARRHQEIKKVVVDAIKEYASKNRSFINLWSGYFKDAFIRISDMMRSGHLHRIRSARPFQRRRAYWDEFNKILGMGYLERHFMRISQLEKSVEFPFEAKEPE